MPKPSPKLRKRIPIKCGKCGAAFALNLVGPPSSRLLEVGNEGLTIKPVSKKPSDPLTKGVYAIVCPKCDYETLIDGTKLFGGG